MLKTDHTKQGKPLAALVAAYTNSFRANDFKWVWNYSEHTRFPNRLMDWGNVVDCPEQTSISQKKKIS